MKKMKFSTYLFLGLTAISFAPSCNSDDSDGPTPTGTPITVCGNIETSTKWTNHTNGVDYIVRCNSDIQVFKDLTIEAGTEVVFEDSRGMVIENGGSLNITGTSTQMVKIHGSNATPGSWKGIWFLSSSNQNVINYCELSGGGQASFNGHDIKANIRLTQNGRLSITNSLISNSGRDGLYVDGLSSDALNPIGSLSDNTFSGNLGVPISTTGATLNSMDGVGSSFTSNGMQYILVRGGALYGTHVWKKSNVPYHLSEIVKAGYFSDEGRLTVQAGTTIEFENGAGLSVGEQSTGYLRLEGSTAEHIRLLPASASDYWKGVCIQSTNAQNLFSYVDIHRGGSGSFTGNTAQRANIIIGGSGEGFAVIQNCTINGSQAYGIYVTSGSTAPTITNTTYSGNASDDYYQQP